GEGPPLVSLHGAGGLRISRGHELLAASHRVIAFEAPGFGSSRVNDRTASLRELAQTMLQAVTALGLDRYRLWGQSFGGKLALWIAARIFGVAPQLTAWDIVAAALLLAPFWAFGFGLADRLPRSRFLPVALLIPYLLFALPRGVFRWDLFAGMLLILLLIGAVMWTAEGFQPDSPRSPGWPDFAVLALLGISVDLKFFDAAWPAPGLNSMTKLMFVDAGLYAFLVLRPIGGIGYDFRPRLADLRTGLREWALFTPIAIALGFALNFLHWHKVIPNPAAFGAGWIFTLFFIAVPEELFFRGLLLNLLERKLGAGRALFATSVLFGLAHFNKRAAYFNWRYVLLAAIAGIFYGRAWLSQRRVLTSSVTHATVDTLWSIWFR
ncbi:MAG: alpha/beta fold hydrolase, partial [Acidobacteriota bacterium]|nr:alpha/beta fold hydrolase [Acidobacteriota bacterium]